MTPKLWMIAAVVVLIAGLIGAVYAQQLRVEVARAEVEARQTERDQARDKLATAQAQLEVIERLQARHRQEQEQLRADTRALETAVSDRQKAIRKLQRENERLRTWAVVALPDSVVRLRERPALTGASAYREFLSDSGALLSAGERPTEQRGSESAD